MSRKAYWDYVEDLITPKDDQSAEEKFSISKTFYTFIKRKKTDSTGIKTLKTNGATVIDPDDKADLSNNHFHSVFFLSFFLYVLTAVEDISKCQ